MAQKFNEGNFNTEVLQSEEPVLVDFYADWCGPCRMMGPLVEQLADAYNGKVKVGKVNVDEDGALAGNYGIQSIPSFLLFKNGQVVDSVTGGVPQQVLQQMIERQMA
ncbi:MAG: thioredoxin [Lachnospiraceae bacterium]|nr:thioredoxin [Lachnospiraceae bacterium]